LLGSTLEEAVNPESAFHDAGAAIFYGLAFP
jgi:hypothetical protein